MIRFMLFLYSTLARVRMPLAATVLLAYIGTVGWSVWISFTSSRTLPTGSFVGLAQYERLFETERWMVSLHNVAIFGVLFIAACLVIGFLLAVFIDQKVAGEGALRTIFLYPYAMSFVATGLVYVGYLAASGEWRRRLFLPRRDAKNAFHMALYYLRLRREHPPQGKHNALQKAAYTGIVVMGAISVLSGFAIYKPVQLWWLTALFGGFELARYWHFVTVWIFVGFTLLHVVLVLTVDPASLRAMITGWYRGRFPSHDPPQHH